jgi:hypothetical protein
VTSAPLISYAGQTRRHPRPRPAIAAALLMAACVLWAALPLVAGGWATVALVLAAGCGVLAVTRLVAGGMEGDPSIYHAAPARIGLTLLAALRAIAWAEGLLIAALVLEAMHHARPYHTGLLGIALLGYLLATQLAESDARLRVLRPQWPLLAAGLGVLALATAASMLVAPAGPAAAWLRVIAIVAAIVTGGVALPL